MQARKHASEGSTLALNPGQTSPEVQTRDNSDPTKSTDVLQLKKTTMCSNFFHHRLELIVCIRDHQNITNGTKYWTKLSVQYDTTKIYVASFATEVLLDEELRNGQLGIVNVLSKRLSSS